MAGEKSAAFDNALLQLIFNGTSITGLAQNTLSSPYTTLYCALHTADPTASGNQSTNEISYTGYARVAVGRTSSGWVVSGSSVSPVSSIIWPSPTGSATQTATYWSVSGISSGSNLFFYAGPITPSIVITVGIPPTLTTATTVTET